MIHPTAIVELSAVDASTNIWAYAHVMAGAVIGKRVNIGDHCFIEGGTRIGDNVTIKNGVYVWEGVSIEDDAFIGPRVTFTNDRHPRSPRMPSVQQRYADKNSWLLRTRVGRGASIGAAATICPGLILHEYCMVAAGAVVTRDVPPYTLVAGLPAVPVGDVCSCGQPLEGSYRQCACSVCGEEPEMRQSTGSQAIGPQKVVRDA